MFNGYPKNKDHFTRFVRGFYDDFQKCLKCGSHDVSKDLDSYYVVCSVPQILPKFKITCNKCGERASHLEWRTYGLTEQQINKFHRRNAPWENVKIPLWAIGDTNE